MLILGSLPSVSSREKGFYYGHPRNRFWEVLAGVYEERIPREICEKRRFLLEHGIALWDVIGSCRIRGSSDSSIRDVIPAELCGILQASEISRIFCNGEAAGRLYRKYQEEKTGMKAVVLPSTSPANAAWSSERLKQVWREALLSVSLPF